MADYPVDNQTDVLLNKALVHAFSEEIDPESVFSGSVVLYEQSTNKVVDGEYSWNPDTLEISFLPDTLLNPNTSYVWFFTGEDTPDALPLELANGDPLPESFSIGFMTGTEQYSSVSKEDDVTIDIEDYETINDGQSEEQREADEFKVVSTTPELYSSEIDVCTETVTITFSTAVKTGQDFDSLIKLSYEPLLRETNYFKDTKFNPLTQGRVPGVKELPEKAQTFLMPTGTWELSEDGLTLTWTKEDAWNANAFIKVVVSKDLLSSTDLNLNNSQDEEFYFLTDIFPLYSTIESTLLPLSMIPGMVSEETVLKYLLKHSLDAWYCANKCFALACPPRAAIKYAECATVVSLIDMKTIANELNRGKRIQLADLEVEYGFPRSAEANLV